MLYKTVRLFVKVLFALIFHPRIIGRENIPSSGPVILAGNHTNNLDCLLLISTTKREINFLGKHILFEGHKGHIMRSMKVIPVDRTKKKNPEALNEASRRLELQEALGIFPEGTINRTDNTILPFKMGTIYLAQKTASPIVPFIIKGKYRPFKNDLTLTFLKPFVVKS